MTQDYLMKAISQDGYFRAYALQATQLVNAAAQAHQTSRIASVVLGRALLGTLLTATSVLKGEERMNVTINGRGPIGNVVVEGNAHGVVRGYVTNPQLEDLLDDSQQLAVGQAVGVNGTMQITKLAPYANPYMGQLNLLTGEIGDEFTYYLAQSEQIPSVVGVSIYLNDDDKVGIAGGFLVQTLPGATEEALQALEARLAELPAIATFYQSGKTPEDLLQVLLNNEAKIVEKMGVQLAPEPTKEAYADMLKTLPAEEIIGMIEEDHGAEIVGKFSGKKIVFSEHELREILAQQADK
jgi:molecular chaperone Hsp33